MTRTKARLLAALLVLLVAACGDDTEEGAVLAVGGGDDAAGDITEATDVPPGVETGGTTGGSGDAGSTTGQPDSGGTTGDTTGGNTTGVEPPPVLPDLLALTVTSGPSAGGTQTVILTVGYTTDFRNVTPKVLFGALEAPSVQALSFGVLLVTTPAGPEGPVDVQVSVPGEADVLKGGFSYLLVPPTDYVLVRVEGAVEADGVPIHLPVTIELHGNAKPAALLVDILIDLAQLPLIAPTPLEGTIASGAGKVLHVNTAKNDGVRMLVLGKNRNVLAEGTLVTLVYNLPPTDPWSLTPLTVVAQAVDPMGVPIPVVTQSGWLGVSDQ